MMSQPFNLSSARPGPGPRPGPGQDFMMMNNNYLPGISRLNGTSQLPFDADMSNTHSVTPEMTSIQRHLTDNLGQAAVIPDCGVDTGRISVNDVDCGSGGNEINMTGPELSPTVRDICGPVETAGVVTKTPNICEHQGPGLAQNLNISQNSGWSNNYNTGSLEQSGTSNFTFTTPTQSYLHSPALTATTQNRLMRPQTFAPGCTIPWQHSAPKRLPTLRQRSFSSPQPLSIFTGSQSSSVNSVSLPEHALGATHTYYSPQMNQPVASCSAFIRRPKRRHTVDTDDFGPQNKIYLTEEKIANHMKELRIHNLSPPAETSIPTEPYVDTGQGIIPMSDTCYPQLTQSNGCSTEMLKHSQRQWHDFKLLEERLEMIDEDSASDSEDSSKSEPVLRIAEGIEIQPQSVIPQDILDKIRNPCQEVVLWSPPNAAVKKLVASDEVIGNNFGCESGDMMEDSVCGSTQSEPQTAVEDTGMETEPLEDMLEL